MRRSIRIYNAYFAQCYEVLKNACTDLKGQVQPSGRPFTPIITHVLNPKSITMGQLYGEYDLNTHEWTDGILPSLIRSGIVATDGCKRWYIFDGPVDAVWIENMNTVLDDNKKLCLTSGEIMKLLPTQTMIFEVADLRVASPATVSRCGMVYMEPEALGLEPFVNCWIKSLPTTMNDYVDRIAKLTNELVYPGIKIVREKLREIVSTVDAGIIQSYINLMNFRIGPMAGREGKAPPSFAFQRLIPDLLSPWAAFATVWSLGASCDYESRCIFSDWFKTTQKLCEHDLPFPEEGLVFDYRLHDGGFTDSITTQDPISPRWYKWFDDIPSIKITADMQFAELLPTPDKSHYTFNLRDLGKVFQGILMANPGKIEFREQLLLLWYHENIRVFSDRLVNDTDRMWFDLILRNLLQERFNCDIHRVIGHEPLFFSDFCNNSKDYEQITDVKRMEKIFAEFLEDYNSTTTLPMKLVLFQDAIDHICRINRILRQPRGNALLLGMGGSGRQSLTRLSSHMQEYTCFQIELSKAYSTHDWREDIKELMLKTGLRNQPVVFLFSDTQVQIIAINSIATNPIKNDSMLEDLNNILNSGDIPNIYQQEEMDNIYQAMRGLVQEAGLQINRSNLFSAYLRRVRRNLHTIVTMSPIGEIFRARIRQFPALVNCCTIDWFCAWPDAALRCVAMHFLAEIKDESITVDILGSIEKTCQHMHTSVIEASDQYTRELDRHNYVTATSYLELLSNYGVLLKKKKSILDSRKARLVTGLSKLSNTETEVKDMQRILKNMKPDLERAAEATTKMIDLITRDTKEAEKAKAQAKHQEEAAAKLKRDNQLIRDEAEADLSEAKPMLEAAEISLKALNKGDITEVKAMKRPPVGVLLVIEAMCIVTDVKPHKLPGKNPGEKILDYWTPGTQMLADPGHFLYMMENFNKEDITEEMIKKLKDYIKNPNFQPEKVLQVSKACHSLCLWIHAMYNYYFVNLKVAPKMEALAKAEEVLAETEKTLAAAMAKLKEVEVGVNRLQDMLRQEEDKKAELERQKQLCEDRMARAVRLITGLSEEQQRWIQTVTDIDVSLKNAVGDILLASGAIAYLTPFTDEYREALRASWYRMLEEGVPHTPGCKPVSTLGDQMEIRKWQIEGLPRDALSVENAVLVMHSNRWPLFIDPQGQANKWIRNMVSILAICKYKEAGLAVIKMTDKDVLRVIENCVRFGRPCLMENVGTELEATLDTILTRSLFTHGGQASIKIGDNIVPYNFEFRFYLTTKLPNPQYTPETAIKVLLVNFALTETGLLDQMLSLVTIQERPDLEQARNALIVSNAEMKQELKELEDRILHRLSVSEGSTVDDLDLILTLEASKDKSAEIKEKVAAAEITQSDIDTTRALYNPVAKRAEILFFCLSDLQHVDRMYQYSLEWFITIFNNSILITEKSYDVDKRIMNINMNFTYALFSNVCRSLFEKHKLHYAFLVCARIRISDKSIDTKEWRHFLSENLPNKRMLVLKCLRPDKITNAMQIYLAKHLGQQFVEPQTTELSAIYNESSTTIPVVFVLSTGTDPAAELYKFADKLKMGKKLYSISLGQGQGPRAEAMMKQSMEFGYWVFFQNCHLAPSWMPKLEALVETLIPEKIHRDFRLWLTSTPSVDFPVSILQNSSKMTMEPPRGIKANMSRAYITRVIEMQDFLQSGHPKIETFKSLVFSLCLFHSVLLERRKFGPLGFNIPYEFTDGDLSICLSQLHMFLLEYTITPFKVLIYTAGHINYGGRITDDFDRRCVLTVLEDYYNPKVLSSNYQFDLQGFYRQLPAEATLNEYIDYIRTFPLNDDPALFGMHPNADISCAQAETYACLDTLLALQPRELGTVAASADEVTTQLAKDMLSTIPESFDLWAIQRRLRKTLLFTTGRAKPSLTSQYSNQSQHSVRRMDALFMDCFLKGVDGKKIIWMSLFRKNYIPTCLQFCYSRKYIINPLCIKYICVPFTRPSKEQAL
ncbi:hypothetical protein KM043_016155 [Ampulex compressa]|nr:hypothetical protein KM043_016155 [Ampulex compressa]